VTQEWYFAQPELTFVVFSIDLMISQSLKHNAEMLFILFLAIRIDQDVINEDHDKLVKLCHEYRVHQIHEVSRGNGQPKRYHQILIETITGGENSLGDIFLGISS
jgi:hypothetical protein